MTEWLEKRWLGEADEAEQLAAPVLLLELCKADAGACRTHPSLLALCLLAMQDEAEVPHSHACVLTLACARRRSGAALRHGVISVVGLRILTRKRCGTMTHTPPESLLQQVLATLKVAVNAQTWTLRKHAAQALCSLAIERRVSAASALELMAVCTDAMAARPWTGKEALYEAAAALAPVAFVRGDSLEQSAPHTALANAYGSCLTRSW